MLRKLRSVALLMMLLCTFSFGTVAMVSAQNTPTTPPATGSSNPLDTTCADPEAQKSELCGNNTTGNQNPIAGKGGIIAKILQILIYAAGIAAVIAVVIGGFEYVISAGDPAKIETAKNTILYALIGLLIAVFAEAILKFVIRSL